MSDDAPAGRDALTRAAADLFNNFFGDPETIDWLMQNAGSGTPPPDPDPEIYQASAHFSQWED